MPLVKSPVGLRIPTNESILEIAVGRKLFVAAFSEQQSERDTIKPARGNIQSYLTQVLHRRELSKISPTRNWKDVKGEILIPVYNEPQTVYGFQIGAISCIMTEQGSLNHQLTHHTNYFLRVQNFRKTPYGPILIGILNEYDLHHGKITPTAEIPADIHIIGTPSKLVGVEKYCSCKEKLTKH